MANKYIFFIGSMVLLLFMYSLSMFGKGTMIYDFRGTYGSSLTDPLELVSLFFVLTAFILLFFNDKIFGLWLKKFMIWFAPLSVVLIATGSVEVNYGWPTRASMAINLGVIMVATTLIFGLVQHFYYKTK